VSRRSNIRKRERQKQRHAQRPKPVDKSITRIKTSDLIEDLARPLSSHALFSAALQETQSTKL
jgi:hypothetical protein